MKRKVSRVIWGVCLILMGVIFALNSFDILDIHSFFNGWWTLFIIIPSFVGIFFDKIKSINVFFFVLGLSILLYSLDVIQFQNIFDIILCFIFILLGVKFIFGSSERVVEVTKKGDKIPTYFSAFGSSKKRIEEDQHCKVVSIFEHQVIDLSDIKCKKYDILLYTILGSCELIVNKDDKVVSNIFSFIGTFKNGFGKVKKAKRVIYLHGFTFLGGVSIKTK